MERVGDQRQRVHRVARDELDKEESRVDSQQDHDARRFGEPHVGGIGAPWTLYRAGVMAAQRVRSGLRRLLYRWRGQCCCVARKRVWSHGSQGELRNKLAIASGHIQAGVEAEARPRHQLPDCEAALTALPQNSPVMIAYVPNVTLIASDINILPNLGTFGADCVRCLLTAPNNSNVYRGPGPNASISIANIPTNTADLSNALPRIVTTVRRCAFRRLQCRSLNSEHG